MSESKLELTVLGARGSMACAEPSLSLFGGDSSCYMVRAGEETIFLDAGTGLLHAPASFPKPPLILLSHLHLDHLVGLGMFPGISAVGQHPRVYVPFCESKEQAESILDRLYSPPFWPLRLGELESRPALLPMPESLTQGEVRVESIPGNHPGGCLVFRLSYRGKRLVYATDFEHEEGAFDRLAAFADAFQRVQDAIFRIGNIARQNAFAADVRARARTRLRALLGCYDLAVFGPHIQDAMLMAPEALAQVQGDAFVCVRHTYPLEMHERSGTFSPSARNMRADVRSLCSIIWVGRITPAQTMIEISNKTLCIYTGKY